MAHKQTQRPHNVVLYDIVLNFFSYFKIKNIMYVVNGIGNIQIACLKWYFS